MPVADLPCPPCRESHRSRGIPYAKVDVSALDQPTAFIQAKHRCSTMPAEPARTVELPQDWMETHMAWAKKIAGRAQDGVVAIRGMKENGPLARPVPSIGGMGTTK
jgi:hypothetical protein